MQLKSRVLVDAMREEDIPQIQVIEREIFPTPWPKNAYYRELHHNRSAYYLVLRLEETIVGYAGLWKMSDEAHITTVGVRAGDQGKGYGHALMAALIRSTISVETRPFDTGWNIGIMVRQLATEEAERWRRKGASSCAE